MQKISIIGLGYVGFPLAHAISLSKKYNIFGFDINQKVVDLINKGENPIDTGASFNSPFFSASTNTEGIKETDIFIVCVPTPIHEDNTPDFFPLLTAIKTVSKYIQKDNSVIIESTVNPGVCEEIIIPFLEKESGLKAGKDFILAHCPERINPGDSEWNVTNIPRNVGATTQKGCKDIANMYRSFIHAEIREMRSIKEAEATKIVENTFRDINIAYVNELAKSFDAMNIDLISVLQGASNKPFGFMPHFPGCGVGGHCIPVDPYYLIHRAKSSGFDHKFLRLAREINNSMPNYTVQILINTLKEKGLSLKGKKIGILGISYKGNIQDTRESPSYKIQSLIKSKGGDIEVFDPYLPEVSSRTSLEEILEISDIIIIATDHNEFKKLSFSHFLQYDIQGVIDGKNIFQKEDFLESSIFYRGIGQGKT